MATTAEPGPHGDLAVARVRAAALTNLDIAVASGRHYFSPERYPVILGRECVAAAAGGGRFFFTVKAIPHPYGSMAQFGCPSGRRSGCRSRTACRTCWRRRSATPGWRRGCRCRGAGACARARRC